MSETGIMRSHMPVANTADLVADFNPFLAAFRDAARGEAPGAGQIFRAADRELIVWQTRPALPSEYELALADALEQIFGQRIHALADVVAALNREGVRTPHGEAWTERNFQETFRELGKLAFGGTGHE
jgi:hypothetical protein